MSGPLEDEIVERLDAHELRFTTVRRELVRILRTSDGPLTLPELLDRAHELAQSSAYRNLSLLEEAGVVRRLVHGNEHARFELAEALTEHHHHLVCETCGRVRDVTLGDELEARLERAFEEIARSEGFSVGDHAIDVYGVCADCADCAD